MKEPRVGIEAAFGDTDCKPRYTIRNYVMYLRGVLDASNSSRFMRSGRRKTIYPRIFNYIRKIRLERNLSDRPESTGRFFENSLRALKDPVFSIGSF